MREYILKIADQDGDEIKLHYDSLDWEMTITSRGGDDNPKVDHPIITMLRQEDVLAMARFALEYDSALREHKRDRDNNIVKIGGFGND